MRLFTLFTYLKTKESYDKWITRRVWGFRQQISKAKYPKISQNVGRKHQEASGEHHGTVYWEKTLRVSAISGSEYVHPEKLKRPPLPSGCEISRCKMSAHKIPDMKCRRTYPDVKCRRRQAIRINSIRIPPRGHTRHAIRSNFIRIPLEGNVACSPIRTREHHTRTIAYPIRMCCPDHCLNVSNPCYNPRFAAILSGHLLLLVFRICLCQRTSKLRFYMFLSFPLLCHGFQRTLLNLWLLWWSKSYQNTKT